MWQPRSGRHPHFKAQPTFIVPEPFVGRARCVVILYFVNETAAFLNNAEQKILDGMLSVLSLPAEQMMLVRVYGSNPDLALVTSSINEWQPESVLQLSMDIQDAEVSMSYQRTYSPVALLQDPTNKPQAFKDLLTLRNILQNGTP